MLERVGALPGVEQVALTGYVPMGGGISVLGVSTRQQAVVPFNQQPVTQFRRCRRRLFQHDGHPDRARPRIHARRTTTLDPRVIIINEAMARREFPNEDPIGHRFSFGPDDKGNQQWVEIVGVVGNVRQYRADQEPVPMTYAPNTGGAVARAKR